MQQCLFLLEYNKKHLKFVIAISSFTVALLFLSFYYNRLLILRGGSRISFHRGQRGGSKSLT